MTKSLSIRGGQLDLSTPVVMGIVNVTPDSFSDGARLGVIEGSKFKVSIDQVLSIGQEMLRDGAAILDIGGESTRPGADPVSTQEELDRVIPAIEALHREFGAYISIDTSSPEVMREACDAGAVMINDVRALRHAGALDAAMQTSATICLMHSLAEPKIMQQSIYYNDVVSDVFQFLKERIEVTIRAGIPKDKLVVDPGFGFGKTLQHNLLLLRDLAKFSELGVPLLVGVSRKSMIGLVTNKPVTQRLAGSLAATTYALMHGASIIRTHDVAATKDAIRIHNAVMNA